MAEGDVRAAIYCRISLARIGDTTKTADQERICRELAARLGWEVAGVYTDNSESAWQKNRNRPAWNRMLADVDAGLISGVVVYHGDRLVRRPEDLADLMRLADGKGVRLASPTGTHNLDTQRLELWIKAAFAEEESTRTSERKKAQYERMRRAGRTRPGGRGGRAFGFERDGITHRQDEADAARHAAALLLSGRSLRSVTAELNLAGVRSTAGEPLSPKFRRTLLLPRMAGLMPDGVSPAAWEPVLDRAVWEELRTVLSANLASPRAGQGALHLLAGIALCGRCGHALYAGSTRYRQPRSGTYGPLVKTYRCPKGPGCGSVRRNMELLDAYVAAAVVARLSLEGNPEGRIPAAPGLAAEFASLTAALAETDAALADPSRGGLTALLARRDGIIGRLGQLRDLSAADAQARLRGRHAGITLAEFNAMLLPDQRALTAACVQVTVLAASGRGPGFREEDVLLRPVG